jgi:4-aminobutyrate aminotransferase-like enzyme/Ser/Thr protein kinase RdoA (MazF antagonist)/murein DD-endopeptidase MepM/ murein hydrolase activator NlpD
MSLLTSAPRFTRADAERIGKALFAFEGTATPLTSERDQNWLLTAPDRGRAVLKFSNSSDSRALIEAQNAAMMRVAKRTKPTLTQHVHPSKTGALTTEVEGHKGQMHLARLVTFLPGTPAGTVRHLSKRYRISLGNAVARLTEALKGFDHKAAHREFYWDLSRGFDVCAERIPLVRDRALRDLILQVVGEFERNVGPIAGKLPTSVVHNDCNDFNVLVEETRGPGDHHVTSILDFGDMVHSWTIADLAIAATYACLGQRDPLAAIDDVVRGYAAERRLTDPEYASLLSLIRLRMAMSVCIAAEQTKARPRDAYLSVSQKAIAQTLTVLAAVHPRFAEASFRIAGGVDASPNATRVKAYLKRHASKFKPILGRKLDAATTMPIPLDVGSALVSGDDAENAEPLLTARIFAAMKAAGASITFGGYGEARLLYSSPLFADADAESPPGERRSVHLGIDLFGPAGTPVHAPLSGIVVAAMYNPKYLDYGGLIIIAHKLSERVQPGGPASIFYTIYGHLSRSSLKGVKEGDRVKAGQRIGSFGEPNENGGWTPHLHFQVSVDLVDMGTDFPGVARPTQMHAWMALSPDPTPLLGLPAERIPPPVPSRAKTFAVRHERLGANLSIAYRDPVKIARGHMQYLWDDVGRKFLDAYNNVPHVGHAHPRIVAAAAAQMAVLNTNTRYLHDAVTQYASEILATLPRPLTKVFFVNSGSEANELALRLARAHTGNRDMIVQDASYHGNTTSLIELSPYKHNGAGGDGPPVWVHAVPVPDDYRGRFKRRDPRAGAKYAGDVRQVIKHIDRLDVGLAGFIAESMPSVGGQLLFPPGYLKAVYALVRDAGGVCIADEVQTGYGRIGTHFWGFQQQGVVPDIVVLGKPIGNGYPIGAVVTTPEIAESFNNGMEFFSTFGGSTVSAVVGLEVLRTTHDERLMEHARRVGDRMLKALRPFVKRFPLVGDVRGSGLFLGVELVRDKETLDPAGDEASYVVDRMREEGILLGTDGPHHNVLKIRPPMPFTAEDADTLVTTLAQVLEELTQ